MTTPPEDVELIALEFLCDSDGPVGSLRLAEALREHGVGVAEATAGRYLYALQRAGLTTAAGPKRGRTITTKGRRRLTDLRRRRSLEARGASIAEAVHTAALDDLVAVLHVRRGIESEAAGLAAVHGTTSELKAIRAEAERHLQIASSGAVPTPEESSAFHLAVSKATHNPVLISVAAMLLDPANAQRLQSGEDVSKRAHTVESQAKDHMAIAEALLNRDSAKAEQLMREHLSGFLTAAETYQSKGRTPDSFAI